MRIRRVKRTARRSNGGALSIKPRSRGKTSIRGNGKKMKGGAAISGESNTGVYSFRLDDYFYKEVYARGGDQKSIIML